MTTPSPSASPLARSIPIVRCTAPVSSPAASDARHNTSVSSQPSPSPPASPYIPGSSPVSTSPVVVALNSASPLARHTSQPQMSPPATSATATAAAADTANDISAQKAETTTDAEILTACLRPKQWPLHIWSEPPLNTYELACMSCPRDMPYHVSQPLGKRTTLPLDHPLEVEATAHMPPYFGGFKFVFDEPSLYYGYRCPLFTVPPHPVVHASSNVAETAAGVIGIGKPNSSSQSITGAVSSSGSHVTGATIAASRAAHKIIGYTNYNRACLVSPNWLLDVEMMKRFIRYHGGV